MKKKPFTTFRQSLTEDVKPLDPRSEAIRQQLITLLKTNEKNLDVRMRKMGLTPACGRCGGSGHYSFNLMHGTTCFGCAGLGHMKPSSLKGWQYTLDNAKRAVANGQLDEYTENLASQKRVDMAQKAAMKTWTDTGISAKYNWNRSSDVHRVMALQMPPNQWMDLTVSDIPAEPPQSWMAKFSKELLIHGLYSDINSYFHAHYELQEFSGRAMESILSNKTRSASDKRQEYNEMVREYDKQILPAIAAHHQKLEALMAKVPSIADAFMRGQMSLRYKNRTHNGDGSNGVSYAGWIEDYIGSVPSVLNLWYTKLRTQYKQQFQTYAENI